ncbi:MFS general substrate transporter [Cadophora sp. DSE1049]|nr:MFS general substrate transporter [Cadophora sp. DSE1049]
MEKHHNKDNDVADSIKFSTCQLEHSQQTLGVNEATNGEDATGKPTANKDESPPEPPYCVLSERAKVSIILTASFAAIISPISGSIYFPALNSLAHDLHVSVSLITLTITTYLIFQGIAPSFIGNFSDRNGRRPAYIICFVIYIGANVGLALQNNYAALMVLRCLQSSGSSGTIALGSAVVADVSTRAQRGKYIGYASMGVTLGPALGPIIGGLLDEYLGWRSIFWFLTIFAAIFFVVILIAMPESARNVVGNGSVPPPRWQLSLIQYSRQRRHKQNNSPVDIETRRGGRKRPNPFASLKIAAQKEAGLILWYGSLLYAGYFAVLSTLSPQLTARYGFNSLKVGLCYLPLGIGSLTSRWTVGRMLDKNFHRLAQLHGIPIIHNRQQDISSFPVEFARLQITLPLVYGSCVAIVAYSWVMEYKTSLAGPLVMLFFVGHLVTGAFSSLNTLVVDINKETPATAVAANNLFRCLMGAGAAAIANPLIDRIGIGWTGSIIALLWVAFSPSLWAVRRWGLGWRAETQAKQEQKRKQNENGLQNGNVDLEAAGTKKSQAEREEGAKEKQLPHGKGTQQSNT